MRGVTHQKGRIRQVLSDCAGAACLFIILAGFAAIAWI